MSQGQRVYINDEAINDVAHYQTEICCTLDMLIAFHIHKINVVPLW